jgi:hypothetical protein
MGSVDFPFDDLSVMRQLEKMGHLREDPEKCTGPLPPPHRLPEECTDPFWDPLGFEAGYRLRVDVGSVRRLGHVYAEVFCR